MDEYSLTTEIRLDLTVFAKIAHKTNEIDPVDEVHVLIKLLILIAQNVKIFNLYVIKKIILNFKL